MNEMPYAFEKKLEYKCTDTYIVLGVRPTGTMLLSQDGSMIFFLFFGGPRCCINSNKLLERYSKIDNKSMIG
jgi:hypothetical protein